MKIRRTIFHTWGRWLNLVRVLSAKFFNPSKPAMNKYNGTHYKSKWDTSTWMLLLLVAACCLWPILLDEDWWLPVILTGSMLILMAVLLKSTYYRIDGHQLVIYQFFVPTALPIDKIKEIKKTKSILSAPATSLTDRIAISFTDRSVLKSSMPLIISPANREAFIKQLLSINPNIKVCF